MPRKHNATYTLHKSTCARHITLTVHRNGKRTEYELTRSRYDLISAIANSGAMNVEILDSGWGIAWEMRRKASDWRGQAMTVQLRDGAQVEATALYRMGNLYAVKTPAGNVVTVPADSCDASGMYYAY